MLGLYGLHVTVAITCVMALRITDYSGCNIYYGSQNYRCLVPHALALSIADYSGRRALRITDCSGHNTCYGSQDFRLLYSAITFVTVCRIADYVSHNIYYGSQNY
jgi:hypothetical protein